MTTITAGRQGKQARIYRSKRSIDLSVWLYISYTVYGITLPLQWTQDDFEYYIQANDGNTVSTFPVTAPQQPQTVVVQN